MKPTDVFISYSARDRQAAADLRDALRRLGIVVWTDEELDAGSSWREQISAAVEGAKVIVLLVGSGFGTEDWELFTRRCILGVMWSDATKKLIPVMLPGSHLPSFVVTANAKLDDFMAIRLKRLADTPLAAKAIATTLTNRGESPAATYPIVSKLQLRKELDQLTRRGQERLREIEEYARSLPPVFVKA